MNKSIGISAFILVIALSVSGCGNKANDSVQNDSKPQKQEQADNGQKLFQKPDLIGQVESLKNGQFALKVVKQPEQNGRPTIDPNATPMARQNDGQNGGREGGKNGNWQGRGMRIDFTGETKNVSIPDGTPISQYVRGQNSAETIQLKPSDIKVGQIIQIWYSDKEKGTISKINVMQAPPTGTPSPDKEQ